MSRYHERKGDLRRWRKDGPWSYEFQHGGVPQRGNTGTTHVKAAQAMVDELKARLARQALGLELPPMLMTLEAALNRYLAHYRNTWTKSWLAIVELNVRVHCAPLLALPLSALSTDLVIKVRDSYLAGNKLAGGRPGQRREATREAQPRTKGGANAMIKALKAVCHFGLGEDRPLPFKVPKLKPQKKVKPVVHLANLEDFFREIDKARNPHVRLAVRLMFGLGLRETEALNARWEWMDWTARTYTPGDTKAGEAKARHLPDWLFDYLKSVRWPAPQLAEQAEAPLPPRGTTLEDRRAYDRAWKARQRARFLRSRTPLKPLETGWMMMQANGETHEAQFTTKSIARAGAALGIHGLTPHRMRGSFATFHHLELNTPLGVIKDMLGQEDVETTLIYVESTPKEMVAAQARFQQRVEEASVQAPCSPLTIASIS